MAQKIAILGIHTDIGKTVTSAVIVEALHADYWKPVQAGDLANSDSIKLGNLISNTDSIIHPEAMKLLMAASPHTAAANENRHYNCMDFQIPETKNQTMVIETAGGLFSPMDARHTMLDFVLHFKLPVVLVSRNYLGNINHTLLCLDALQRRSIKLSALIINGERNISTEQFIQSYGKVEHILYINELKEINKKTIFTEAINFRNQWNLIDKNPTNESNK